VHISATEPGALAHGVSVVLPVYRGGNEVGTCLASLAAQTLDPARFEVVVVINGEPDGTARVLADFRARHPKLDIRVVTSGSPGAGRARNAGLAAARFAFSTFVDHDDYVSPYFLESLLDRAGDDVVSIAALVNILPDGALDEENVINRELRRFAGRTCTPSEIPRALSFNAAKLVPTVLAREVGYETGLTSGEDMVFFSRLFHLAPLLLRVCPPEPTAVYYRVLRENSVSRRAIDFGFAVRERLEVMSRLDQLSRGADDSMRAVLAQWITGQADFVNRYLRACPADHPRVVAELDRAGLSSVPHASINRGVGTGLVVAYDLDLAAESGHGVASAIRAAGCVVDIVRRTSEPAATSAISAPYTERDVMVRVPDSGRWDDTATAFREGGVATLRALRDQARPYRQLYSFGADPATLMLALVVALPRTRLAEPGVTWTAHLGLAAQSPEAAADGRVWRSESVTAIRRELARRRLPRPRQDSLVQWCVAVAALLADRIVVADEAELQRIKAVVAATADPGAISLIAAKTGITTATAPAFSVQPTAT
jgi:poly(ribitol-phosphate) beta-N-acetylglucosaminyltransferase